MWTEPSHRPGSCVKKKGGGSRKGDSLKSTHVHLLCFLVCPNASRLLLAQQQANSPAMLFLCSEIAPSTHGRKPPSLDLLVRYLVMEMKAVQIQRNGSRLGRYRCKSLCSQGYFTAGIVEEPCSGPADVRSPPVPWVELRGLFWWAFGECQ